MKPMIACPPLLVISLTLALSAAEPTLPDKDQRAGPPRTTDTPRVFPKFANAEEWKRHAAEVRQQALVSCGLWPLPDRTPLNARVFGRVEREDYTIEKVHLQSYTGFYLAGNLYRPKGRGSGPFPAVLNPHGHWAHGRLHDSADGSIPARCINFARQGMVAFAYDMVGYNDTHFNEPTNSPGYRKHRRFGLDPTNQLWNISLMGLQTWNSIRALDFLESLPDVDRRKIGCTGASGGGTQTFMLGAIDDRLAAQAPNVMVSSTMQGGCLCENAPALRVEYSNMEFAAAAAPRPQLLVGATGDWTRLTLEVEGPALASIYRLLEAPGHLRYVRLNYNHNYNQASREQVYGWFGRWLRDLPQRDPIPELPYLKGPDADYLVFPNGQLPPDAVSETQLIGRLMQEATRRYFEPLPRNPDLLARHREQWLPAWRHTFLAGLGPQTLLVETQRLEKLEEFNATHLVLGRAGQGDRLPAVLLTPRRNTLRTVAVVAHPEGRAPILEALDRPNGLARVLLKNGVSVLTVDTFLTGDLADAEAAKKRDYFANFFTTYNRTDAQERVQDLLTCCALARSLYPERPVALCGVGRAGLWALMAAPAADLVAADCDGLDTASDQALLARDLFVPGIRRLGSLPGVALLAATNPLLLHQTGTAFDTAALRTVYDANRRADRLRCEAKALEVAEVGQWVADWLQRVEAKTTPAVK